MKIIKINKNDLIWKTIIVIVHENLNKCNKKM